MIDRTFIFNASVACQQSKNNIDARCVYFSERYRITELEFFSEIVLALKASDTLPDCMVLISTPEIAKQLKGYWDSNSNQRKIFLSRGERNKTQYIKDYHFFSWSSKNVEQLHVEQVSGIAFSIPIDKVIDQGLQHLVTHNDVVQVAPAGHMFRHPSGTRNKVFIQARELAKTEPQLEFVGKAIYSALKSKISANLAIVFIDTMSIYPYVREALAFASCTARIQSFHSYDDVEKLAAPTEEYIVIISASTSGGMARELGTNRGFDQSRLMTLIDMSTAGRCGKILVAMDAVSGHYANLIVDGTETEIELVGEHFSSKAKPPRAVTIGKPHTPKDLIKVLEKFGIDGLEKINYAAGAAHPRTVCLRPSKNHFENDFIKWLTEEISWSVSLAIDHIICTDDDVSKWIAEESAQIIKTAKGSSGPTVISYESLNNESLKNAQGVLIVTAIAGDGGKLREISRDLREYIDQSLPRHFLVGVGLPQTIESWILLRQFLERNTTNRRYGFSAWQVLPIGPDNPDNAWKSLIDLSSKAEMYQLLDDDIIEKSVAEKSLENVSTVIKNNYHCFLPKMDGSKLSLSDGFLFFGNVFEGKLSYVSDSVAYLAVTSVLQCARDTKSAGNQLKSTGYESVVLAPECFLRYNDNLLQACFLRACHPSELDYSTSPHFSKLMKEFLNKMFSRYQHPYGGAALEFAAALATGRLKLKKSDFDDVVNLAIDHLKSTPSALLGFLLLSKR